MARCCFALACALFFCVIFIRVISTVTDDNFLERRNPPTRNLGSVCSITCPLICLCSLSTCTGWVWLIILVNWQVYKLQIVEDCSLMILQFIYRCLFRRFLLLVTCNLYNFINSVSSFILCEEILIFVTSLFCINVCVVGQSILYHVLLLPLWIISDETSSEAQITNIFASKVKWNVSSTLWNIKTQVLTFNYYRLPYIILYF